MGHHAVWKLLITICVFVAIECADPVYVDPNDALRAAALVQPTVLANPDYVTQNVYGFADFTTTIGNTVMIFSPHSIAPPTTEEPKTTTAPPPPPTIETKPIKQEQPIEDVIEIRPTKPVIKVTAEKPLIISSVVQIMAESPAKAPPSPTPKAKVEIVAVSPQQQEEEQQPDDDEEEEEELTGEPDDEDGEFLLQDGNNIGEPEYDFLSRQPTEFVEETFRVVNLKPSSVKTKAKKTDTHPTGLVTKSGGTVVKDGVTTVHETSVIGTFISGKYAQVLQSTSHIFHHPHPKPKISPSSTLRILKTAAPSLPKQSKPTPQEDALAVESIYGQSSPNLVRSSRRPANPSGTFKNRFRNRNKDDAEEAPEEIVTPAYGNGKKVTTSRRTSLGKPKNSRTTVETAAVTTTYESRRNKASRQNAFKPSTVHVQHAVVATESFIGNRKSYKPKVTPQNGDNNYQLQSIHPIKLNRTLGRWKYKTTPKPRVTIRKHGNEVSPAKDALEVSSDGTTNDIVQSRVDLDVDLDGSGSVNGDVLNDEETGAGDNAITERKLPIETIKVEISTPADFSDTYYEIATIKSPYTFQVGSNKNTRYITVTSTFKKTIEPETSTSVLTEPLTENILATTSHIDKEHNLLDSSIATLPPITLADDQATPPLETLTETFSTTQIMLKTHILPVIRGGTNTTSYTLIQTYHVTRLVTATKTLPPMEVYQFVPSRTLNEFNSKLDEAGSELHLELEFGDENEHDEEDQPRVALPPDLDLSNIGVDFDISEVDKSKIPRKQQPRPAAKPKAPEKDSNPLANLTPDQLALLRLLNPAQIPSFITTSKPIVHLETVYESHVIPIINGDSTFLSTISRPVATVSKTEYEIGTSALLNYHQQPTQQQPLQLIPQQHHHQQQQQFQLQSTPVVEHRTVTQTDSKILKLTFGAKTAYTTLYNTRVIPTMVTSFVTQSIAVQQSAPYPGYFPGPYPPYPYVG